MALPRTTLSVGVGAGQSSYDDEAVVGNEDGSSVVGFANYTMGPITAGITMSDSNNTRSATAANTNTGGREVEVKAQTAQLSPYGRLEIKRHAFAQGYGAFGNREELINALVKKMM